MTIGVWAIFTLIVSVIAFLAGFTLGADWNEGQHDVPPAE